MSIFVKQSGVYQAVTAVFAKANGVYGPVSVDAKVSGAYVNVGDAVDPVAPTLGDIASFLVATGPNSSVSYEGIPWTATGVPAVTWPEAARGGITLSGVIDVDVPIGAAPVGGWPVVMRFHATGEDYQVGSGGYIANYVKEPGLQNGFAFIPVEFRHPVSNADQGFPKDDIGRAIQKVRALATALNLNPLKIYAVCASRGNLVTLNNLRPNLVDPGGLTYESRMDSDGVLGIWAMSGQATYEPLQWALNFCSQAAASGPGGVGTAYDAYLAQAASESPGGTLPAPGSLGSAMDLVASLPAASPKVPKMVMVHKEVYHSPAAATLAEWPDLLDDKHYSNNGQLLRATYVAAGYDDRIMTLCGIDEVNPNGREDQFADSIPWFMQLELGLGVKEAWAIVHTRRRAGLGVVNDAGIYYLPATTIGSFPAFSGAAQFADGTTPVSAVASPVGGLIVGSYGRANRALAGAASGVGAGQTGGTNKPTIQQFANGARGFLFDSTDRLIAAFANGSSTQSCFSWCNTAGVAYLATTAANLSATQVFFGQLAASPGADGDLTNKVNSLTIIHKNAGGFDAQDIQGYAAFARELDGVAALTNP